MTPVAVLCLLAVLGGGAVAVATDSISSLKCTEYATLADRHQCAAQYKAPHIEGKTATRPGEFPHMAHVGYTSEGGEEELLCGGSLISPHFVLTSAVCVTSRQPKFVVLGKGGSSPQRIRVAEGVAHPDFNRTVSYNDIALLRLAEAAALSDKVRPACLHRGPPLSTGDMTVATGWGATELGGDLSESLQKVALAVVDHAECNRMYSDSRKQLPRGIVSDIQICAGGGRSDTCQGDSGGPLQVLVKSPHCTYQIVGITSFGRACMSGPPGVYTRVAPFVSWIEKTVWP